MARTKVSKRRHASSGDEGDFSEIHEEEPHDVRGKGKGKRSKGQSAPSSSRGRGHPIPQLIKVLAVVRLVEGGEMSMMMTLFSVFLRWPWLR